jgi:hypothetical protein
MTSPSPPTSIGEALDREQYERIRGVHEREEREREAIPVREYAPHRPQRVPSVFEER